MLRGRSVEESGRAVMLSERGGAPVSVWKSRKVMGGGLPPMTLDFAEVAHALHSPLSPTGAPILPATPAGVLFNPRAHRQGYGCFPFPLLRALPPAGRGSAAKGS